MATWRTCGKQVTKFFPCLGETLLFWFNSKKKNLKPLLKLFEWMRIAQRIDSICVVLRPIPPLLFIANRMFWLPRTQSRLHEKQPWSMALDYVCLLGWTLLRNFVFSNLMKASKLFFLVRHSLNASDAKLNLTLVNICFHELYLSLSPSLFVRLWYDWLANNFCGFFTTSHLFIFNGISCMLKQEKSN